MSLKVWTSFTFDWKIITNEQKNIMMQLPFNYNSLWDKRWWGLELKSEEKIFLDQPWHSILEGRLLATYFCDLWTLWYWGVTYTCSLLLLKKMGLVVLDFSKILSLSASFALVTMKQPLLLTNELCLVSPSYGSTVA